MFDMYAYSGFQFGLVMLGFGIVAGIMIGWGIHKTFFTVPAEAD